MRTSKRTAILDTIVEIIETNGFSEVTYENVATQCGMSKSGLIYHFPSREDMIRSVHEHMAQLWEEELIEAAGGPQRRSPPPTAYAQTSRSRWIQQRGPSYSCPSTLPPNRSCARSGRAFCAGGIRR
ncbi:TetR/AcrR family transcriptional regulator [Corynebacterium sp. HMSC055G02]|uniref:TetR/AcrR family transcriptional regulator n=1 Tax=Corynebacterium sp. HMSC055G02 TaxID=1715027 RepID=UPI001FEF1CFB|nr:TetR/AcrR family transcriptional regulator [Corynebacterium sp. HMSC055G02]